MKRVLQNLFLTATVSAIVSPMSAGDRLPTSLHYAWTEEASDGFRSTEAVYETNSGRACFRRVYIPEEIGDAKIRGVIVWDAEPHYYPRGVRTTVQSPIWRAFAAKHKFGMAELATRPIGVEKTAKQIQSILEDMDRLYDRTECKHACFTFAGTSGTGHDALELAAYKPIEDRLIAGVPCSVTLQGNRGLFEFGDRVPILIMAAGMEERDRSSAPRNREQVTKLVREGKPFTLAVRLSAKHPEFRDDVDSKNAKARRTAHAMLLAMTWLEAIFEQRLPDGDTPAGRSPQLRDLDATKSWLATYRVDPTVPSGNDVDRGEQTTNVVRYGHTLVDCKIDSQSEFSGGRSAAEVWLPSKTAAVAWKTYHETGEVLPNK